MINQNSTAVAQYTAEEIGRRIRQKSPESFSGFTDEQIGKRVAEKNPQVAAMLKKPEPKVEVKTEPENILPGAGGITKAFDTINKGVEKFQNFRGFDIMPGKGELRLFDVKGAGQAAGGIVGGVSAGVGGLVGGAAKTIQNIATNKPVLEGVKEEAIKRAKDNFSFGQTIGETAPTTAVLGGLTKVPLIGAAIDTATGAAQIYQGGKDLSQGIYEKDPNKIISSSANLGTGIFGLKMSARGMKETLNTKPVVDTYNNIKKTIFPESQTKNLEKSINTYREVLKPTAGEIKNIEVKNNKDINDSYRLMAEEGLIIKKSNENKLDTTEAQEQIKSKFDEPQRLLNDHLSSDRSLKFDLGALLESSVKSINKLDVSAIEKADMVKDISDIIGAEMNLHGKNINGETANAIKGGLWKMGYNQMRPTANKAARLIANKLKNAIENTYPDSNIRALNKLVGDYATALHLLESAHGRVVKSGQLGIRAGQIIGGLTGSGIPIIGPITGGYLGGKVTEVLSSPERMTTKAQKYYKKSGVEPRFKSILKEGAKIPNPFKKINPQLRLEAPKIRLPERSNTGRTIDIADTGPKTQAEAKRQILSFRKKNERGFVENDLPSTETVKLIKGTAVKNGINPNNIQFVDLNKPLPEYLQMKADDGFTKSPSRFNPNTKEIFIDPDGVKEYADINSLSLKEAYEDIMQYEALHLEYATVDWANRYEKARESGNKPEIEKLIDELESRGDLPETVQNNITNYWGKQKKTKSDFNDYPAFIKKSNPVTRFNNNKDIKLKGEYLEDVKYIPIDSISSTPEVEAKFSLNTKTAKSYIEKIKKNILDGKAIEPPMVSEKKGRFNIEDGRHRIRALRELGYKKVPVIINDAFDF